MLVCLRLLRRLLQCLRRLLHRRLLVNHLRRSLLLLRWRLYRLYRYWCRLYRPAEAAADREDVDGLLLRRRFRSEEVRVQRIRVVRLQLHRGDGERRR